MKRFVIGDIHGAHKALAQCLERSGFRRDQDELVCLGDVCDGWPETDRVIEELLTVRHVKPVLGNHDEWFLRWITEGWCDEMWTSQGGQATLEAYRGDRTRVPEAHIKWLESARLYWELDKQLFIHAGLDPALDLLRQNPERLLWDRLFLDDAIRTGRKNPAHRFGKWDIIFLGHTPTSLYASAEPIRACNVWAMDTGAGWSGRLSIMDTASFQWWQSDPVPELYPSCAGRKK